MCFREAESPSCRPGNFFSLSRRDVQSRPSNLGFHSYIRATVINRKAPPEARLSRVSSVTQPRPRRMMEINSLRSLPLQRDTSCFARARARIRGASHFISRRKRMSKCIRTYAQRYLRISYYDKCISPDGADGSFERECVSFCYHSPDRFPPDFVVHALCTN